MSMSMSMSRTRIEPIAFSTVEEVPPLSVSLADMGFNHTGSWRYLRPEYGEGMPPCRLACPAGTDLPRVLAQIASGEFVEAWRLILRENPFPGVCGRVCDHPCQVACNRGHFDEVVSIQALERLAADACRDRAPVIPQIERREGRVAVVGSGPAGLSCAWALARRGYNVTVFEAEEEPGGMLRVGIPKYRLPREVLDKEIQDIVSLGVALRTGVRVDRDAFEELIGGGARSRRRYDAVFVATGAHRSRRLGVPGQEHAVPGLAFLRRLNRGRGRSLEVGRAVAVIGGGNTAVDCARSARRLGAAVEIVYRRTREEMPAIASEVEAAEEEGVHLRYLAAPRRIERRGRRFRVTFQEMRLGEPDESGRRRPVPLRKTFTLRADTVIAAIGEGPELDLLGLGSDREEPDPDALRAQGVFLGGDAYRGAGTVVGAIASGKRAARAIEAHLRGEPEPEPEGAHLPEVPFERLNPDHFLRRPRARPRKLPVEERLSSFVEVQLGLEVEDALSEAARCFSCGVCNACDNCLIFCPEVAVSRNGDGGRPGRGQGQGREGQTGYTIDYDYCKGCGLCAAECPRGVIILTEEQAE